MKKYLCKLLVISIACGVSPLYGQSTPNNFNDETDLFIAQFDSLPDSDDIYAQAAVASLLAHPDFLSVNYFCVAGAYGSQTYNANWQYIDSRSLFALGFGQEALPSDTVEERAEARWVDAHGAIINGHVNKVVQRSTERIANMDFASEVIVEKAKPILQAGGKVWVMEAGQSDLSADWIEKLIADGVTNTDTNVIIVQHSNWNQNNTAGKVYIYNDQKDDWGYVTSGENNTYYKIDDGNHSYVVGSNETPDYLESATIYMEEATSASNPNTAAQEIWALAEQIVLNSSYGGANASGGIDFSDTVEAMWIFDLANQASGLTTVRDFWDAFVVNIPQAPSGLVAHWAMDEGAGNVVSDITGNGHDVMLSGAIWDSMGARGAALEFQAGSGGMTLPSSAFSSLNQEITIAMWVNGASNQPVSNVNFSASAGGRALNIHLPWSNGRVYWDAGNTGGAYDRISKSSEPSTFKGGWNHWVFTKNTKTGVMSIYVNGILLESAQNKTRDMTGITEAMLGANYNGSMDEVMLFDKELNAEDVLSLYDSQADLGVLFSATSFNDESHPQDDTIIKSLATAVALFKDESWIRFDDFNFGVGASSITVSATTVREGTLEVRIGSPTGLLVGSTTITDTGGWNNFQNFLLNFNSSVSGVEDLYLVSKGGNPNAALMKIESFQVD